MVSKKNFYIYTYIPNYVSVNTRSLNELLKLGVYKTQFSE